MQERPSILIGQAGKLNVQKTQSKLWLTPRNLGLMSQWPNFSRTIPPAVLLKVIGQIAVVNPSSLRNGKEPMFVSVKTKIVDARRCWRHLSPLSEAERRIFYGSIELFFTRS